MSKATETAEREALAAEAEFPEVIDPDDDDGADVTPIQPEEPAEPEGDQPAEPSSEEMMEEIGRKLDEQAGKHSKAVARIMGDQMGDLVPCPLCITPGFVTVEPPPDFDPDQRAAVLAAMGDTPEPALKLDPDVEMCPVCDGWGETLTGSKSPNFRTKACPACQHQGWRLPVVPPTPIALNYAQTTATNAAEWTPPPPQINDPWGRPPGAEFFNQDPATNGGRW